MASRGDTIDTALALKNDADVVERLRKRMPDAIEMLERIACGDVPRNAQSILKGIETMLRFSQPLPKVTVEHQGSVGIAVINPYAAPEDEAAQLAPPALPASSAVVAVEPIRRRKEPAE